VWVGGTTDSGDGWAFIEGAPAGGGETLTNPCDKWFCKRGCEPSNPRRTAGHRLFG
jgi:hypothetical protein